MRLQLLAIFFVGVFLCQRTVGQGLCNNGGGGFELNTNAGCAPLTVNITNTVQNPILIGYNVNYDGVSLNPSTQDISSYVYALPGVYRLLQQGASASGKFYQCKTISVLEARGISAGFVSCGGGKVIITIFNDPVTNAYDQVEIDFGDGEKHIWKKGDPYTIEHLYTSTASSPLVKFIGLYNSGKACDKGAYSSMYITFQQPQLNSVQVNSLEMKGNGILEMNYLGVTGVSTDVQYSSDGNTYTTASTRSGGGTQVTRINGLAPAQVYKIKLASKDLCGGAVDSEVVTSMALSGGSADEVNTLTWNQYPSNAGFVSYELFKDGVSLKIFSDIGETSYKDEDVQCGDNFEYQVVTKTGKVISTSAPFSIKTTVTSPKTLEQASVTVLGDKTVAINAVIPGAGSKGNYELIIEKANPGTSTFRRLVTLYNENEYLDQDVNTGSQSYCYRISYQNACGQRSPASEPICTILLTMSLPSLSWTSEKPFLDDVNEYTVLKKSGASSEELPVKLTTSHTPKFSSDDPMEFTFQVQADSENGLLQSFSNILSISRNISVFVPDAFSPDGDGENETFVAKSKLFKSFSMSVLNRWGQVIFHSDDINKGWDGTINGANAPVGSYVYRIAVVDIIDQTVEKNGTFMLFR
jgi:gliding motility-associated-like protein